MKKNIVLLFLTLLFSYSGITQNVGVNTTAPQARLHVFDGSFLVNSSGGFTGAGHKLVWLNGVYAFRAGYTSGNHWNADSAGLYSFAAGEDVVALGNRSASLGYRNRSAGRSSFSTGTLNVSLGENAFSAGFDNYAAGENSFAAGSSNSTGSNLAVALGAFNQVNGFTGFAAGYNNMVTADYAVAIGRNHLAASNSGVAIGFEDTVSTFSNAIAIGRQNKSTGIVAVSLGDHNVSTGDYSLTFNSQNTASGSNAMAGGNFSRATGSGSIAIGYQNLASFLNAVAIGYRDTASGQSAVALGQENRARAIFSMATGFGNYALNHAETVMGRYADTTAVNYAAFNTNARLFAIGNGINATNRSSAVSVFMNGRVGIGGVTGMPAATLEVNGSMKTNTLQVNDGGTIIKQVQGGTAVVGSSTGQSKVITVNFPQAFSSAPKVVCTARTETGQNFTDVFCVTTKAIGTSSFTVNVLRVDSGLPWAQNLLLDWYAWEQ